MCFLRERRGRETSALCSQNAKDPDYVKNHHPFAKVPAFQDADINLFESRAICRYLANKHRSELGPPAGDIKALALFEQAASVEASYFEPAVEKLAFELIFKKYALSFIEPVSGLFYQPL